MGCDKKLTYIAGPLASFFFLLRLSYSLLFSLPAFLRRVADLFQRGVKKIRKVCLSFLSSWFCYFFSCFWCSVSRHSTEDLGKASRSPLSLLVVFGCTYTLIRSQRRTCWCMSGISLEPFFVGFLFRRDKESSLLKREGREIRGD